MVTATRTREDKQQGETGVQAKCVHFWVLDEAGGRVSHGVCKHCGARKEFKNFLSDCVGASADEYEKWLGRQKEAARSRFRNS